jgi:hypothetical protein
MRLAAQCEGWFPNLRKRLRGKIVMPSYAPGVPRMSFISDIGKNLRKKYGRGCY